MNYTNKNGYKISKFTLGTVQLGLPYGINNTHGMPTYEESKNILQTALDCGIQTFDTARAYGKSEEVLGQFFSENNVEKTIVTKVLFENESPDEIAESLFIQVKDSMQKMNLTKLPFVMLHREEYIDTYGTTIIDALQELKKEGLVGNVGISFSDKSNMDRILDNGIFDCIQIPQNIFDNSEIKSGQLEVFSKNGVSIFIRSVYLQGLFFMDTKILPENIKSAASALDKLHRLAEEQNMSMSQLALSFIKDAKGIDSLVLGCETTEQLLDSASKFSAPPLSDIVIKKILEISEEVEPIVTRPWEWNK